MSEPYEVPTSSGNTAPLQPRTERMEPINFPYRGQQQHGVPAPQSPWIPQDADAQSWEGEEVYDANEVPIEPVPVIIVRESQREIRSWRAYRMLANTISSMCVGQNECRTRVVIQNVANAGSETAYIGHTSNVTSMDGYPLLAGASIEINSEEEVYCITASDASNTVELGILSEHAVY